MSRIIVPLMESWSLGTDKFDVLKHEVDNFLKSDHKHKQPLFVFFQFTWLMCHEKYVDLEYIISYMKHEICEAHGWEFSDSFRMLLQNQRHSREFAENINQKYGFNLVDPIEYFPARSYVYEGFKSEPHWNSDTKKCLMLFGKMSRKYRCDVFKSLADNNLLTEDEVLWSLQFKHFSEPLQKRMMENIDYQKYRSYERSIDDDQYKKYGNAGLLGYPYDEKFYTETCMSVIFETYAEHSKGDFDYLTEKTWRAVANKHPFLLIASNSVMSHLSDMGFHTFTDTYLPQGKDYHFENVINNFPEYYTKFRDFVLNNPQEVLDRVEHNYKRYQQIGKTVVDSLPFQLSEPAFLPRPQPGIGAPSARLLIDMECLVHTPLENLENHGILSLYDEIFSKIQ